MVFFTENELRERCRQAYGVRQFSDIQKALCENYRVADSAKMYDIFLSHSSSDYQIVAGLALVLQDLGYTVYVDWNDKALDRNHVTPQTAAILKERMAKCRCLIYAFSENATHSKWMPWELGYFDGLKGKVAVLPITQGVKSCIVGSEFVGLYPQIQSGSLSLYEPRTLLLSDGGKWMSIYSWIKK